MAQILCVNHLLLDLVTTLLRTFESHGSNTLLLGKAETPEEITLAAAKERLGASGAFYLPDLGSEVFRDSVTIMNVLGNVLRFYLGAALPREPDDMYLSGDPAPYAFRRVSLAWLARQDWSAVRAPP